MKKTTEQHLAAIENIAIELRHLLKRQPREIRRKVATIANVAHVAQLSFKDVVIELRTMEERKDGAYEERNKVVAALAKLFPSGTAKTEIEGWSEDWHGCVYIDLPTGQVSWHFHDSQAHLFATLPTYSKSWDGHDTEEKYRRLGALPLTHATA